MRTSLFGRVLVSLLFVAILTTVGCGDDDDTTGPTPPADLLLEFDFSNFATSQKVGSHTYAASGITGLWNTGNNGVEPFGDRWVSVTRQFGTFHPTLTFTTTETMTIDRIEFTHLHNHNLAPTRSGYTVKVQIDTGGGFVDLGSCVADRDSHGAEESTQCPGELAPGTYHIRWIPQLPLPGGFSNTDTDFFALDDVRLWRD